MDAPRLSIALVLIVATCGCQRSSTQPSEPNDREIAALAQKSASSIDANARAAALAIADRSIEDVSQTFRAIELARELVLRDLKHADATGYKTTIVRIEDGTSPEVQLDTSQGKLVVTSRPLDVAIQGDGFFAISVDSPPRIGYTRSGNLFVNAEGLLVVRQGYPLQPRVQVPPDTTQFSIDENGNISVEVGKKSEENVARISRVRFPNPEKLQWLRDSIYLETESSGKPAEFDSNDSPSQLLQGFLESSNVNIDVAQARLQFLDKWESALQLAIENKTNR